MSLKFWQSKKQSDNTHADQISASQKPVSQDQDDQQAVLSEADEKFLEKLSSEAPYPPTSTDGVESGNEHSAAAAAAVAEKTELPPSPQSSGDAASKSKGRWRGYFPSVPSNFPSMPSKMPSFRRKSVQQSQPQGDQQTPESSEPSAQQNARLNSVLDNLHLSSLNNRMSALSTDSQDLMARFTVILKDMVNGAPTAYNDLEKLLNERNGQLEKMYSGLPPFLKTLIEALPTRVYAMLAPQIASVAASKSQKSDKDDNTDKKKQKSRVPSLRSLVGEKGAVATLLRSIVDFLELRFPAILTGGNMVMSLAVFLLLFVFWYCHKRGRETRLTREEQEDAEKAIVAEEKERGGGEEGSKGKDDESSDAQTGDDSVHDDVVKAADAAIAAEKRKKSAPSSEGVKEASKSNDVTQDEIEKAAAQATAD